MMFDVRKRYFITILAVGLLTACSNDGDTPTQSDEQVPLRIESSIGLLGTGVTRASETHWDAADKIGVYVMVHNSTSEVFTDVTNTEGVNLPFTYADVDDDAHKETYPESGTTYRPFSGSVIYLPKTGSVDVYGYYPYSAAATNANAIPVSVSNQTSQAAIDFMTADRSAGQVNDLTRSKSTAKLLFNHRLVKLVFNLKPGTDMLEGELTNATLTLDKQPVKATYNLITDGIDMTAGTSILTAVNSASAPPDGYKKTLELIVLPNGTNNLAADRTVTITFGSTTNTFTIADTTSFAAGKKYTYNVTVNATSITVDKDKFTDQW